MRLSLKGSVYFFFIKLPKIIKGTIKGNVLYAYHGRYLNFGDQLTPIVLDHYGFTTVFANYKPKYKFARKAEIISIGSLLPAAPSDFEGIIIGAGHNKTPKLFPFAKILAVRGNITKQSLGMNNENITLGDPGLLVSSVFPGIEEKKYKLGIVPHFIDKTDPKFGMYKKIHGDDVKIIEVQRHPRHVIKEIKQCDNIISSSLHGLVVADAFDIPNIMFINNDTMPDRGVKYEDYYSAFGIQEKFIELNGNESLEYLLSCTSKKGDLVKPAKANLHAVFSDLKNHLK